MDYIPANVGRAYQELGNDPRYQHFVRIPDRIIQCIDYFGITCNRDATKARLKSYYLFIGVVDDAIDSGRIDAGPMTLEYLRTPSPMLNEETSRSSVKLITAVLKSSISDQVYPLMIDKLRRLYDEVISERGATSINSYIAHRKSVGSLTAELSFILIQPNISGNHQELLRFMQQVGAIGCLVDSLIDLDDDRRLGLLGFKPRMRDYLKLIICIVDSGLRVSLRHPRLGGLFIRAIVDNVADRFRAECKPQHPSFPYDRKDKAASVA